MDKDDFASLKRGLDQAKAALAGGDKAQPPVIFDKENPEWTEEDFARARSVADHPVLAKAFPRTRSAQKEATKQVRD